MTDNRLIRESGLDARIAHIVEPLIADLGYQLVRVRISGLNGMTVQIMAERSDGTMTVKGCERISRELSPVLDVEDPISREYHLEVSSPGIDRPLTRAADFEIHTGQEVKIEMAVAVRGRKRYRGVLLGLREGKIGMRLDDARVAGFLLFDGFDDGGEAVAMDAGQAGEVWLSAADMAEAKLVLTDALIAAAQPGEAVAGSDNAAMVTDSGAFDGGRARGTNDKDGAE